jgi:hypothetical protein
MHGSLWSEILKRRDHSVYLGGDGRITLKYLLMISGKQFGIDLLRPGVLLSMNFLFL